MVAVLKEDSFADFQHYLAEEHQRNTKHELIEGDIFAMAGASDNHNILSLNVASLFLTHVRQHKLPCQPYNAEMKVKINDDNCFYPDVMVVCDREDNEDKYYKTAPKIIIEVLSKSTRRKDKTIKKLYYQSLPTLDEYVLIEQDICEVIVFKRKEQWRVNYYYLGDNITFESLDLTIPVAELYYQVNNEDMREFLANADKTKNTD